MAFVRPDDEHCYRAVQARDARFDGCFFTGVTSTGIYCRPSCRALTPKPERCLFFPTAAAAERAGFRACKRCRPDASPGSPEWNWRSDVVARAIRSIHDGVVDREGVVGLAKRLHYSPRQLQRLLVAEVGAGPLDLARAQRAHTARILLETTQLRAAEVAFAAGFGSVRQFNETVQAVFGESPMAMRARVSRGARLAPRAEPSRLGPAPASVTLRLAYRAPFPIGELLSFLAQRAVAGVEEGDTTFYRRALSLPRAAGVVTVKASEAGEMTASFRLDDLRDLTMAVGRVRQMFDLDSDPTSVISLLGSDPLLAPAVVARPGLRIPGHVDGNEMAVRAVIGQQVSVKGARAIAAGLAADYGRPLSSAVGSVTREFPPVEVLASLAPEQLPMPAQRARALLGLTGKLASGEIVLDAGADRDEVSAQLLALPGIGHWTVSYLRMRALGDPDAFLASDLGARRALGRAGLSTGERQVTALAERWRPYRAYALQYLWSGLGADPSMERTI